MNKIKLFLVDDHKMIRDAMIAYLSDHEEFEIVGQANHGEQAIQLIKENPDIDVLLTDIIMPQMDGLDLVKNLKQEGYDFKIVALTMLSETQHIKKMLNYGVNGYLLKSANQVEIIDAIKSVYQGNSYYSPQVTNTIMEHLRGDNTRNSRVGVDVPLTKREKEILKLIIEEHTNQEIADLLFISIRTVEAHKRNLIEKTGHKTMAGLAVWAVESRLFAEIA
jgi:DNA-binding NarL/FixJ family response regulator